MATLNLKFLDGDTLAVPVASYTNVQFTPSYVSAQTPDFKVTAWPWTALVMAQIDPA